MSLSAGKAHKNDPCSKPPDKLQQKLTKEQQQERANREKRIKERHAHAVIAITISEDGSVAEVRALEASSAEAAEILAQEAKEMKFKPRPSCGPFKTTVNFNVAGY